MRSKFSLQRSVCDLDDVWDRPGVSDAGGLTYQTAAPITGLTVPLGVVPLFRMGVRRERVHAAFHNAGAATSCGRNNGKC